jgi:5-methylcytosine-specific restriction enzyme subunit McrC
MIKLIAGDHIGTIVTNDLRIHILPKTPLTNLFFMLTYAYELAEFRKGESPLAVGEDLFQFLLDIFVKQVDCLVRQGIYRSYIDFEEDRPFLRGRLRLVKQLRRNPVQVTRFHQRTNELTADLLENRILKFTLWQLSQSRLVDRKLRIHLRRTYSAFSEVSFVDISPFDCDRVVYNRMNGTYRTPINLAQLFLQHLSLEGHAGETPFMTFLLPMHRIFELFVARYLAEHFATNPTFSIKAKPRIRLYKEGRMRGEPDIVLHKAGLPYMILDTKYKKFKDAPERNDRNQMYIYCDTVGVQKALLIYSDARTIGDEWYFERMTLAAKTLTLDGDLAAFQERCRSFALELVSEVSAELTANNVLRAH